MASDPRCRMIERAGIRMAIYIHDEAAQLRLRVTGGLDETTAKELASCWSTAASVVGTRKIVLDLTGMTESHDLGVRLLEALHREGAEFLTKSAFQSELVAGITGAAATTTGGHGSWLKGLLGMARV